MAAHGLGAHSGYPLAFRLGALSAQHQAQVLDLYDPQRLRATAANGKTLSAA